ncbi:hypothetical protein V1478_003068 [Vespula squamosa]|uniref:Uncharacterized protein n=1 Tax=Vespula squamosa TaxID=30214 RepID=A0ABD2BRM3_VESSQ
MLSSISVGKLLTIGQSVNNALINSTEDNSRRLQTQRDVQRARSAVGAPPGERNYANAKMLPGSHAGLYRAVPCRVVSCRAEKLPREGNERTKIVLRVVSIGVGTTNNNHHLTLI